MYTAWSRHKWWDIALRAECIFFNCRSYLTFFCFVEKITNVLGFIWPVSNSCWPLNNLGKFFELIYRFGTDFNYVSVKLGVFLWAEIAAFVEWFHIFFFIFFIYKNCTCHVGVTASNFLASNADIFSPFISISHFDFVILGSSFSPLSFLWFKNQLCMLLLMPRRLTTL